MNLTILGVSLGTLPAWVPPWAVPAAIIHLALFAALVIPTWVALARARSGGPLALLLILPILGLLLLCPIFMNRVLPYAHWGRFWGILVLIPGLNIFFLWIFGFAPWKRRYIPMDQEEYSEPPTGMGPRRGEPRLAAATAEAGSRSAAMPTMVQGNGPRSGEPRSGDRGGETMFPGAAAARTGEPGGQTMFPGAGASPRTGEPGGETMFPGAGASPRTSEPAPQTMMAGQGLFASRTQPPPGQPLMGGTRDPADSPQATIIPGPQRSGPPAPPREPADEPPAASPPGQGRERSQPPERTQDLTVRHQAPTEAATVRMAQAPRAGGRAWRLVGANDIAAAIDFTVQEAALLETESGLLVGRSVRADFVIDHDSVSRNHARFLIDQGALYIEDLDSMNGTWVDGKKLEANAPVALQPNGIVEIGKLALRVTGG